MTLERRVRAPAGVLAGALVGLLAGMLVAPGWLVPSPPAGATPGSGPSRSGLEPCRRASPDERTSEATRACVAFRFADPRITESSGLVVGEDHVVTVNDSGDTGRVFTVDPATGETIGVTRWQGRPVDVEALAPAGPGHVWVADIGDNAEERGQVVVLRVPVGAGERTVEPERYRLVHPGGAVNAESLLVHPGTGRLFVATKQLPGGRLLAAPRELDPRGVNRLRGVGGVRGLATGGAFLDAEHLVVRSYAGAVVYRWRGPDTPPRAIASFALPPQEQGEAIARGPDGALFLSSEGTGSAVLRLPLPGEVRQALAGETPGPTVTPDPTGMPDPQQGAERGSGSDDSDAAEASDVWPFIAGTLLALVAALVLLRSLRPR